MRAESEVFQFRTELDFHIGPSHVSILFQCTKSQKDKQGFVW